MKKKIVIFDSWTKGVGYLVSPLAEALKASYDYKFIHFESVYNDKFPVLIKKNKIDCFDFSFYKTLNIVKILKQEKPDLVILLGREGLLDRAQIKAAKFLKIPTLFIQHGTMPPLQTTGVYYKNKYGLSFYFRNLKRIFKMSVIYVLTSVTFDRFYFLRVKTYKLLYFLFTNPHKFYFTYPDEVKPDKLAVYGEVDKDFFKQKYGYKDEEIEAVGNPFLDKVCLLAKKTEKPKKDSCVILLLTKPYVEDLLFGWNKSKREKFTMAVYQMAKKHQMFLVVKIHPRENIEDYKSIFKSGEKLEIIQTDIDEAVNKSDLVLSFYSTALYNAIILQKPIIIINWVKGIPSDVDLAKFGIAKRADSFTEFDKILKEFTREQFFDKTYEQKRAEFIKKFLYSDDGRAMERIVKLIEKIIS